MHGKVYVVKLYSISQPILCISKCLRVCRGGQQELVVGQGLEVTVVVGRRCGIEVVVVMSDFADRYGAVRGVELSVGGGGSNKL